MSFKINLEWCTELPSEGCPQKSPVFFLQGVECFFLLILETGRGNEYCYNLYVQLEKELSESEHFKLQVGFENELSPGWKVFKFRGGFENEQLLRLRNGTDILDDKTFTVFNELCPKLIWDTTSEYIQSSSHYMVGNCIQFLFSSESMAQHFLGVKADAGNQSVQRRSYSNGDATTESISKDFSKLFDKSLYHDVRIACGNKDVRAHYIVLCARSEVLNNMLQFDMKSSQPLAGYLQLPDQNMRSKYFEDFVRFLYTDELTEMTFDKAKILYDTGSKYKVKSLMRQCSEYLRDNITAENACQCLEIADEHSDEKLKDTAISYIVNEKVYLQGDTWLPFCDSHPKIASEVLMMVHKGLSESMQE